MPLPSPSASPKEAHCYELIEIEVKLNKDRAWLLETLSAMGEDDLFRPRTQVSTIPRNPGPMPTTSSTRRSWKRLERDVSAPRCRRTGHAPAPNRTAPPTRRWRHPQVDRRGAVATFCLLVDAGHHLVARLSGAIPVPRAGACPVRWKRGAGISHSVLFDQCRVDEVVGVGSGFRGSCSLCVRGRKRSSSPIADSVSSSQARSLLSFTSISMRSNSEPLSGMLTGMEGACRAVPACPSVRMLNSFLC